MTRVTFPLNHFDDLGTKIFNLSIMKQIVVPTDFSEAATVAADYALHVAKYLKSNLELCHSFLVPLDATVAGQVVWPVYDYDSLKEDVDLHLDRLAKALMLRGKSLSIPNTFKPVVEYTADAGATGELVSSLVREKQAGLVVVGMSGHGAVRKFFTGSTSRDLIENGYFPLLLVPAGYVFKPIHKIAFATDLSIGDIEVLNALAVFARCFDAEIVIVHVDRHPGRAERKDVADFLSEVTCKINYDKIYYREVNSKNVNDGLQWLTEHGWIDLMVMVHRSDNLLDRLLKRSVTRRQADRINIPLMVLPEGLNPVF